MKVVIVSKKTGEIVENIKCGSRRDAERVESGVNINLNHDNYYTYIDED